MDAPPERFRLVLPEPVWDLLRTCETECVAGCCGLGAFAWDEKVLTGWLREHPAELNAALDQLSEAVRAAGERPGEVYSDDQFNASWPTGAECAEFLRALAQLIRRAAGPALGLPAFALAWRTATAVALAQGIYDDHAFDRLPILADALQDAGCDAEAVLSHCRGDGPHARGCWVVDAVLGKA